MCGVRTGYALTVPATAQRRGYDIVSRFSWEVHFFMQACGKSICYASKYSAVIFSLVSTTACYLEPFLDDTLPLWAGE
jgi:hypothetical protein